MLQTTKDIEVANTTLYRAGRLRHLSAVCCWIQVRGGASAGSVSALLPATPREDSGNCTAAALDGAGLLLGCASSLESVCCAQGGGKLARLRAERLPALGLT